MSVWVILQEIDYLTPRGMLYNFKERTTIESKMGML